MVIKYGIGLLSIVPIRQKPTDASEMVSQLLFGETVVILDERDQWTKIQCTWDNVEGWIDSRHYEEINETTYLLYKKKVAYALEMVQGAMCADYFIPILMGSTLPLYDGITFRHASRRYTYSGQVANPAYLKSSAELVIKIARKYLYAPYLYGGRSPFGIDSSGFLQMVFRMAGYLLPRYAEQQATHGIEVGFVHEARPGDIAFFANERRKIIHTGILLPDHKIIHVADRVRIDFFDHYGIFHEPSNSYSHRLRVIKRLIGDEFFR